MPSAMRGMIVAAFLAGGVASCKPEVVEVRAVEIHAIDWGTTSFAGISSRAVLRDPHGYYVRLTGRREIDEVVVLLAALRPLESPPRSEDVRAAMSVELSDGHSVTYGLDLGCQSVVRDGVHYAWSHELFAVTRRYLSVQLEMARLNQACVGMSVNVP